MACSTAVLAWRRAATAFRSAPPPAPRPPRLRNTPHSRWSAEPAAGRPPRSTPYRLPRRMRFFEYEAREVVKRAGIPITDYGFTTDPVEARAIAERIGGPTVIKSQVLTGGRMKAGGVRFADTPEEAEEHAREILELEIGGHMPRGVLVDPKAEVEQEYYAGVVWDGIRKQPVMIFSPVGGIDIEQVAEEQPDKVGRRHFSNILPLSEFEAKEVIAST